MSVDSKAEILEAAQRELATRGLGGFSVKAVARRVGMHPHRVRLRFPSKSRLIARASRTAAALWDMDVISIAGSTDRDASARERQVALAASLSGRIVRLASVMIESRTDALRKPWLDVVARWRGIAVARRIEQLDGPSLRRLAVAVRRTAPARRPGLRDALAEQ